MKPKRIPQDVEHRYNSTYLMLKNIIEYKLIINYYIVGCSMVSTSSSSFSILTLEKFEDIE